MTLSKALTALLGQNSIFPPLAGDVLIPLEIPFEEGEFPFFTLGYVYIHYFGFRRSRGLQASVRIQASPLSWLFPFEENDPCPLFFRHASHISRQNKQKILESSPPPQFLFF